MAIAVQLDFPGATLDQYDEVCGKMGLTPGGPGPAGAISHFATRTSDGFRVVDVWESQDAFDRFAAEQIGPHSAAVGITTEPRVEIFEVHNYFTPNH
jgi:hypothetical protein